MAEKVARPRVEFNGKEIESRIDKLTEATKEWRKELRKAQNSGDTKNIEKFTQHIKEAEKETKQLKKEMFSVDNVLRDLNGTNFTNLKKAYTQQSKLMRGLRKDAENYNEELAKQKLLKNALTGFNKELATQEGFIKRSANAFNNYFGLITAGIASLSGIAFSVRKAVDMADVREEVVDDLQALTGLSDQVVQELEQTAAKTATTIDESGVRIKQGADDIVNAYKLVGSQRAELLKDADALHEVTKDAIILSEAAKMQLEPAAKGLTNTLNQFQESADQSRRVINILAAGSQAGAGNIEYLSAAIEKTGTSANLMGISIEETVGTIEAIAPFYSEASMAGNSFDKVLLKLKANQIGYTDGVFDLNDAIDELREMYATGTSSVDIFGSEHAKLGELLVQNQSEINRYTEAVTGSNKAIEQATINTSNNAAKKAQAINKTKEYAVALGKKLQPAMTHLVSTGTLTLKLINELVDLFSKHGKTILWLTGLISAYTLVIYANVKADQLKVFWNNKVAASLKKLFTVIKSNPWLAVTTLILAAVVAIQKLANKTREASAAQREFNKLLKESNDLLNNTKSIEERAKVMHTLSADQLKRLKEDINAQLEAEKDFNVKLLAELRKRFDNDKKLKELYAKLNDKNTAAIVRAGIARQIQLRKEELAADLQLEADKHNEKKKLLKKYLIDIEIAYEKATKENNKKQKELEEDLQKALLELRKQYGLVSQFELYQLELKALDEHKARKLLSEEEYLKARQAIYDKYLKTPDIQEEESDFEIEDPEASLTSQRMEAELDYQNQLYAQTYDYQYQLLQKQWERGEIGWSEYYDRIQTLDQMFIADVMNDLADGMTYAADLSNSITSILSSNLERQKQAELAAAGDNAAKKEEIEIKYRKKQKELALKQAYIDLAAAELRALATPPVPNFAAVLATTLAGAANITAIKSQEFLTGGYTGFDGSTTDVAGIVHKKEFVANAQATANPTVKGVLDIINLAQKNGSIQTLDLPAAISNINTTRGFASGGYTSTDTSPSAAVEQNTFDSSGMEKAAMYIYEAAKIFASKNLVITAEAVKKITEAGAEYTVQKSNGARV